MTTLMDLRCFLCKDHIPYNNNDKTDFTTHMNNEHLADFGIDFLLAACLMELEEREAIQDVIGDKFQIGEKFNEEQNMEDDIYDDCVEDDTSEMTLDEKDDEGTSLTKELMMGEDDAPIVLTEDNINILDTILNHSIFSEETSPKLPIPTPVETSEGFPCPECGKVFRTAGNMKYHFVDIHQPGEFPCPGCQKMYTSKNKMSSHYSRYCNGSNKPSKRRKVSDVKLETASVN